MTPYYQDSAVTIYLGNSREIVPALGRFGLLLTDPPYGIQRDRGIGGRGVDGFGKAVKRKPKAYAGNWDKTPPDQHLMECCISACERHIVWGGNYLSSILSQQSKWLVWDKEQTMPTYSDAELAWTTLPGVAVKMMRYCGAGLMAKERDRQHPTQKPLALMQWCIQLAGDSAQTILDPFMGSGTTLVAAKQLGRRSVGIEMEERYCEVAVKRLQQEYLDFGSPDIESDKTTSQEVLPL